MKHRKHKQQQQITNSLLLFNQLTMSSKMMITNSNNIYNNNQQKQHNDGDDQFDPKQQQGISLPKKLPYNNNKKVYHNKYGMVLKQTIKGLKHCACLQTQITIPRKYSTKTDNLIILRQKSHQNLSKLQILRSKTQTMKQPKYMKQDNREMNRIIKFKQDKFRKESRISLLPIVHKLNTISNKSRSSSRFDKQHEKLKNSRTQQLKKTYRKSKINISESKQRQYQINTSNSKMIEKLLVIKPSRQLRRDLARQSYSEHKRLMKINSKTNFLSSNYQPLKISKSLNHRRFHLTLIKNWEKL